MSYFIFHLCSNSSVRTVQWLALVRQRGKNLDR